MNPLKSILVIIALGLILGLGYNLVRPRALPWKAEPKIAVDLDAADSGAGAVEPPASTSQTPPEASDEAAGASPAAGGAQTGMKSEPEKAAAGTPAAGKAAAGKTVDEAGAAAAGKAAAGTPDAGKAPAAGKDLYSDIPASDLPRNVSLAKAKTFYDRGGLLVLDARDPGEYADGHIQGAVDAPYDQKAGDPDWIMKTAKDPRPILVYCDGGDCELSLDLGTVITQVGHKRVLILTDGYPGWSDAGYPTATGANP